ncbi:MAG: acyl-CoA thioesterase [Acidobacteriota bacterium]
MSEPIRAEVEVEVRYFETDQMGVVHHANYLVWFELARTKLCALSGHHYAGIEELGYRLLTIGAELRYRRPAHYGETTRVACWIDRLGSRGLRFAYETCRDGEILATGATDHIWIEVAGNRPCRMPEPVREPFRRLAGLSE